MDWYVVHTWIGCEQLAACHLERDLQMEVYLAEVTQRRRDGPQRAPLFPGYLFAAAAAGPVTAEVIDRTPGCGKVVQPPYGHRPFDTAPVTLPYTVVDGLRQGLAAVDAASGLPLQILRAPCGQAEGLEAALNGLLTPAARIQLLLQAVGGQEADEDELACMPAAKRLRRTRGQGRRIHYR